MEINKIFNLLKMNEKLILKESEFVLIKKKENIWEITVRSIHGEHAIIIEKIDNRFNISELSRNQVHTIFEGVSEDTLLHGFVFYMIRYWRQYYSEPNYEEVSSEMSLEEVIQSLQSSLKELKFSYFNTPKGVILRQVNDGMYSFEIQFQNEIKLEVDSLDIIAETAYYLSKDIHDFYTFFYNLGMDNKYEDECKRFFLYDDLYHAPSINFFRSQKLVMLRKDK